MDYLKCITEMRNDMHREIVQEATCKFLVQYPEFNNEVFLELDKPIQVGHNIHIVGIDCNTGDIVCEDSNNDKVYLTYGHLSTDGLAELHSTFVLGKRFTIKPNLFV